MDPMGIWEGGASFVFGDPCANNFSRRNCFNCRLSTGYTEYFSCCVISVCSYCKICLLKFAPA